MKSYAGMHPLEIQARTRASLEWHTNGTNSMTCEAREDETGKECPCDHDWRDHLPEAVQAMRFILWDSRKDGPVTRNDADEIITSGTLGRIDARNVYLAAYAEWPKGRAWTDLFALEVGECIRDVGYSLAGKRRAVKSRGKDRFQPFTYDVYRVE